MRVKLAASFSSIVILFGSFALPQEVSDTTESLSTKISELIDLIEQRTGNDIDVFLAEASITGNTPLVAGQVVVPFTMSNTLSQKEVDYGYAVFGENGEPIDLFGPDAPATFTGDQQQMVAIKGYKTPDNSTIQVVGKAEYNKVQDQLIEEMRETSKNSPAGVTIGQVGQKAQQATTALLVEVCPQPYYAEGLTLYMDAGLDFVVFNTETGTELNFVFAKQCSSFLNFLELEAKRRGLIPQ